MRYKRLVLSLILWTSWQAGLALASAQVREAWVARSNGGLRASAQSLAVDSAGNVYVTGYSTGSATMEDYLTIKYDAVGTQLWAARYDGPANASDYGNALAVDRAGNVYVTGASVGLGTGSDFATVKYDAAGNQLWVARYNGSGNGDDGASWGAIALDSSGNIYVTGAVCIGTNSDYATLKYDPDGNQVWVARYTGLGGGDDVGTAIAADAAGYVYVTGESSKTNGSSECATLKYDPEGNQVWLARYGEGNAGSAIGIDLAGNVYISGTFYEPPDAKSHFATIKYDGSGNELWVARYNGSDDDSDNARKLALDSVGNCYVTGYFGGVRSGAGFATVKYDANGHELWVARYDAPVDSSASDSAIAVDSAGNVYVSGAIGSALGETSGDGLTLKYDTQGNLLWVARYDGPAHKDDGLWAMASDSAGNVYVTGFSVAASSGVDYLTIKYVQTEVRLTGLDLLLDGRIQFTLLGAAGKAYDIQTSSDLLSWTSLTNFVSVTGTNLFTDVAAPNFSGRFYRAMTSSRW